MDETDVPPSFVQNVTAVNGVAYGVIGADLHVFGSSGLPVYRLAHWRLGPRPDSSWLRELPSRMLNARFAVVGFTGRATELDALRQWRDSGSRFQLRWLYGAGGQGKSRLADQLALESVQAGWKVVVATYGPGAVLEPEDSQDLRLGEGLGCLVIVDYADRWPLSHLTWLLSNSLFHQARPTRVLLLARTQDAWPRLRAAVASLQAGTSSQFLESLPEEPSQREIMFDAAREAFARRYDMNDTSAIEPPCPLTEPDMGLMLSVHLAALVAVDASARGERPPSAMADLSIYLLDREQLHWARLYDDAHRLDPADRAFATPPEAMNRTVYASVLTGSVSQASGTAVIERLAIEADPEQLLADHSYCYPPSGAEQGTVLEPLYPDRLAEDFLALTIPGSSYDYPAQPWAPPTASALLARQSVPSMPWPPARAVTVLAASAQRWQHVGENCLYPVLRADPKLALEAGSAALTALAEIDPVDITVLEAIEALMPRGRHVDLDPGIAALARRLAQHRLVRTFEPAERARIHSSVGIRLSNAGLHDESLASSEEAARLYRGLSQEDPIRYQAALATSLANLSVDLSNVGRHQESLVATREAVDIHRGLAQADAKHEGALSRSLSDLGYRLWRAGQPEQALTATREAVDLLSRSVGYSPAIHDHHLAISLSNLGADLRSTSHTQEALEATRLSVEICQRLVKSEPAAHEPDLAVSLVNLGVDLLELKRPEEALRNTEEAIVLFRRLARTNPVVYEPDLAAALNNLGICLWETGKYEPSLDAAVEAVDIRRRLAGANPAMHAPDLANSLNNLGADLAELGRPQEALSATREALDLYRWFAEDNPEGGAPDLARSLRVYAEVRVILGTELIEALESIVESVARYQRMADDSPQSYSGVLRAAIEAAADVFDGLLQPRDAILLRTAAASGKPSEAMPLLQRALLARADVARQRVHPIE